MTPRNKSIQFHQALPEKGSAFLMKKSLPYSRQGQMESEIISGRR